MISTLDRMFLFSFFRSYAIVWTSVLSLYVVIDLFTNIDSFGRAGGGFRGVVEHVTQYYRYQIALIFNQLSDFITLLAAMFTLSWMQRNNELLPQLSAGIPTRRVLRPILFGSAMTLSLGPLNQELIIPDIASHLMIAKDDPEGAKPQVLMGAYDPTGVHIEGVAGVRLEREVKGFYATFPEQPPSVMFHMEATSATYTPPDGRELSGGWTLFRTKPETLNSPAPSYLKMIDPGKFFLRTDEVDYDIMSRGATWFLYASTPKLRDLLQRSDPRRQAKVAVMFHMRLTRPLVGGLLVMLGLAVILQNPNRHIFISAGLCLVFSVWFYLCVLGCKFLGDNSYVAAPLAAWLPVLLFGPLTIVAFDSIYT